MSKIKDKLWQSSIPKSFLGLVQLLSSGSYCCILVNLVWENSGMFILFLLLISRTINAQRTLHFSPLCWHMKPKTQWCVWEMISLLYKKTQSNVFTRRRGTQHQTQQNSSALCHISSYFMHNTCGTTWSVIRHEEPQEAHGDARTSFRHRRLQQTWIQIRALGLKPEGAEVFQVSQDSVVWIHV